MSGCTSFLEIQNIIYPTAPSPSNYKNGTLYKNVYEKDITLKDGSLVKALVCYDIDIDRVYVNILYEDVLCTVFAKEAVLNDEFFLNFNLQKYS